MTSTREIKKKFERSAKAVKLRPSVGLYSSVSRCRLREGLTCDIDEGPWKLIADMGQASGGEALGPTPGVYGRAALGACVTIATAQYAAKLDVPLDGLEVEVQADADAGGAYDISEAPAGYTQVRCIITVKSAAPEADVRKVVDKALDNCVYWDVFARALDLRRELRFAPSEE